jgi:hypothetical protein
MGLDESLDASRCHSIDVLHVGAMLRRPRSGAARSVPPHGEPPAHRTPDHARAQVPHARARTHVPCSRRAHAGSPRWRARRHIKHTCAPSHQDASTQAPPVTRARPIAVLAGHASTGSRSTALRRSSALGRVRREWSQAARDPAARPLSPDRSRRAPASSRTNAAAHAPSPGRQGRPSRRCP